MDRAPAATSSRAFRTHVLALADQAVVSGTSFLVTIMIGRWTGASELGVYAIGISLLISWLAVQESLISIPYAVQRHGPFATPPEYAGSSLAQSGLLSVLAMALLAATAVGLSVGNTRPELVPMIWALAAVMPFALLREFGRRFAFAHLSMVEALLLDVAVAAIQITVLAWLAWTGRISAVTACAALGIACGLIAVLWLWLARGNLVFRLDLMPASVKQSWRLGKWLFAGQITLQLQIYMPYWLTVMLAGTGATGVYAACMSVVAFANPLVIGIGNTLVPRAALAGKQAGAAAVRRQAMQNALFLGAVMTAFCAVILIAGDDVLRLLYHGPEYQGQGHTLAVLALALLAASIGMPASSALVSMGRPQAIVWTGGIGAGVTAVLVACLVVHWGVVGAAYGVLIGNMVGTTARWAVFLAVAVRARAPATDAL